MEYRDMPNVRLAHMRNATKRLGGMEEEARKMASQFSSLVSELASVASVAEVNVDRAYGLLINLTQIPVAFENCVRMVRFAAHDNVDALKKETEAAAKDAASS